MALTGFSRSCAKRSGGVRSVALVEADKISSALYNSSTNSYSSVSLLSGAEFAIYEFMEDTAEFTETTNINQGSYSIEHHLSFSLERTGASTHRAIDELVSSSNCGIVAIVTTTFGDSILVGYSEEFENERPLRISTLEGGSGQELRDATRYVVKLHSEDTSFARPYTGDN